MATLALVLLGSVGPVAPAGAQQQGTRCTADFDVNLSPGIGSKPVSGAFHTDGETGTIDCGGGRSAFGNDGRFGTKDPDTCTGGGEGWGVMSYKYRGKNIKSTFTYDFGGISGGLVKGNFDGEHYSGTFTFTPTEGDCVNNPATKGRVHTEGVSES
jgi:hypothetical protein